MKKIEEIWEPCSDWGRSMKPYLDQVKRQAVIVIRKPRPEVERAEPRKRNRVHKPKTSTGRPVGHPKGLAFISDRKCEKCETYIRVDNKHGLCQKHYKQMQNRIASERRRECRNALRLTCNREGCTNKLNSQNKTGLCDKHSIYRRQLDYLARKKAA